jgi:hypothetical protein
MANEISATATLSASKGGAAIAASSSLSGSLHVDMAGAQMISNVQVVGTSAEAIVLGDVSTIGYVYLKNMDAANFVEIALDSGVSTLVFAKLKAGGIALFPAKTATMYAKADTAEVNLFVAAVEL